jgi:TetR/AcrR family transcriptional regulator of autoinduction and epiphytic fitness
VSSTFDLDEQSAEPLDGRTARAVRTREAIVDATLALLAEGEVRPTAPRIAERAGVSVRSVFQHFDDLETLYAAVGSRITERVAALIQPIDPALDAAERLVAFFRQRGRVNEALTPTLRAAVVHAPGSPTINSQFQSGHDFVTAHLAEVFRPELERVGEQRELVIDAMVAVATWSTWNSVRQLSHRSEDDAVRVVAHLAAAVLGEAIGEPLSARVAVLLDQPDETPPS